MLRVEQPNFDNKHLEKKQLKNILIQNNATLVKAEPSVLHFFRLEKSQLKPPAFPFFTLRWDNTKEIIHVERL
jgi:hypothetical protein